jgi:hypothetical protein
MRRVGAAVAKAAHGVRCDSLHLPDVTARPSRFRLGHPGDQTTTDQVVVGGILVYSQVDPEVD